MLNGGRAIAVQSRAARCEAVSRCVTRTELRGFSSCCRAVATRTPFLFFLSESCSVCKERLGRCLCDRLCSDRFAACIDPFSCAANSAPSCTVRSCVVALGHARRSFFLSFEIFVFLILSFRVFQPLKKPFFTRCIVFQHFSEHCSGLCAKCMVTGVAIVNLVVPPMTALALSFFSGCRGG